MSDIDFPPFPAPNEKGPQVCAAVSFYLAIIDDLSFDQVRVLSEHIRECEHCAKEARMLRKATRLVATLPASAPSARVDEAVLTALQSVKQATRSPIQFPGRASGARPARAKRLSPSRRWTTALALVASLFLLLVVGSVLRGMIFPATPSQAFQMPAHLSWNGYVLHYRETKVDTQGKSYQVEVYQDLGSNQMHIESTMQGKFDVVVVTDAQTMLGKDMLHDVAQKGGSAENWAIDGSQFNLSILFQDLKIQRDRYVGTEIFQGQPVYLVRVSDQQVLVLNRQYLPINILNQFTRPGTGVPAYQTFALMHSTQVSDEMWNMQVPPGFHMGTLPARA